MRLTPETALKVHLAQAREYWRQDRLDLANAAIRNALRVGIPAGDWYDLQRIVEAEWGARQASRRIRVSEHLILEASGLTPEIRVIANRALAEVSDALAVAWAKPILLTLFPSDEWVEFMHARYGYYTPRTEAHKIGLPPSSAGVPHLLGRAARHEMTHAAVNQLAGESAPRWLNEGLAVLMEGGPPDNSWRSAGILRLDEISAGFESFDVDLGSPRSLVCYAAAGDFVRRMAESHGLAGLRSCLTRIGASVRPDRAFRESLGISLSQAERQWQQAADG